MDLSTIVFDRIEYAERVAEAASIILNPSTDTSIHRVTLEGKLMGGVVYTGYTGEGGSINMHVASFMPRWISKFMLWVCFDYPFNQLGVKKIFGQVATSNPHALAFDLNLGFKQEAIIKDVYPGGDMHLLAMYREDCRFLTLNKGRNNGRKIEGTAAP